MANGSATITIEAGLARAYNAAPPAMQQKAQALLWQALTPVKTAPLLSKQESELLLRINRTLADAQQQRFDTLTEKRLDATLTKRESSELESLITEFERLGVDRLQAVIELARLRKVPPATLAKQMELGTLV